MPRPAWGAARYRSFASGAVVASFLSHAAGQFAEQRLGGIASPLAFLRRHVGHVAESSPTRVLRGDDDGALHGYLVPLHEMAPAVLLPSDALHVGR
jgi:hypothetical protein